MKLLKKILSPFLIVIVIPLIVYLLTAPHQITGFGDSDELLTSGYFFGLPHPPGYPLFNILVFIFTHIPIPLSIAYKAYLISIFSASLAIGIFYLLCMQVLAIIINKQEYITIQHNTRIVMSISLSLLLAFTPLYWSYALVSEVFALNTFLVITLLYLAILQYQNWRSSRFYLICLFLGLGLSHQQIIIILIPFLIFLLWNQIKKNISVLPLGVFISLLIPVSLYIFLFRFGNPSAPQSWHIESTPNGYIDYILRNDYRATNENNAYLTDQFSIQNFQALFSYFQEMLRQLSPFIVLLSLLGIFTSWKLMPKRMGIFIISMFLITGPGIGFYLSLPQPPANPSEIAMGYAITQRMYLIGLPFYILLAIFTIASIYRKGWLNTKIISAILICFPAFMFLTNLPMMNLHNYKKVEEYSRSVLKNLPNNATLICFSDISCFSLTYTQSIEKIREDVTLIPITPQMQNFAKNKLPEIFKIHYSHNPNRIAGIISWGLYLNQQIFITEINPYYIENLGLDSKILYLSPFDLTFEITKTPQANSVNSPFMLTNSDQQKLHPFEKAYNLMLFEQFARNGTLYARLGGKTQANEYYTKSLLLNPKDLTITQLIKELPKYSGNQTYLTQNKAISSEQVLKNTSQCNGDIKCLLYIYQLASIVDPTNNNIRNILIDLYKNAGVKELAQEEADNVQTLSKQF